MVTLECKNCGQEFETSGWQAKRGRKYCGVPCANEAQKGKLPPGFQPSKVTLVCQQCGKEFKVWKSWVKRGRRKYCNWDCKMAYQRTLTGEKSARFGVPHTEETKEKMRGPKPTGQDSPHWKGGKYETSAGYLYVHIENLKPSTRELVAPMITKSGYILEHRLIMAVSLGRPLMQQEKVHHLNGNKRDNRLENLQIFPEGGHSRKHREVDRELSKAKAEIARLKSLLAMYQVSG